MSTQPLLSAKSEDWSGVVFEDPNQKSRHVPTYMAIVAKKLESYDQVNSSITFSFTLIIRVYAKGDDMDAFKTKLRDGIPLRLNEQPFFVKVGEDKLVEKDGLFVYTIRRTETISFPSQEKALARFPFDTMDFVMDIEFTSFRAKESEEEFTYRFNVHRSDDADTNLSFKSDCDGMPQFNIDTKKATVSQIAERKEVKDKSGKKVLAEHYFPKMRYTIPLYREPEFVLLTYMSPLIVIQIFTLVIMFQGVGLSDAIANLATIFLALIAYLPTLRSQIPDIPTPTIADKVIYVAILQTVVGLFYALVEEKYGADHSVIDILLWLNMIMMAYSTLTIVWNYIAYKLDKKVTGSKEFKKNSAKVELVDFTLPEIEAQGSFRKIASMKEEEAKKKKH